MTRRSGGGLSETLAQYPMVAVEQQAQEIIGLMDLNIRSLVNHPKEVRLELSKEHSSIVIQVHVNLKDVGQVIGNNGRTARALRTLLEANGVRIGTRFKLDIVEADREVRHNPLYMPEK